MAVGALNNSLGAFPAYHGSVPDEKKKRKSFLRTAAIPQSNKYPDSLRGGPAAMIQTDPIFLGVVPRSARSYVAREIVRLGKPLFNPCAGRFSVIEAALRVMALPIRPSV